MASKGLHGHEKVMAAAQQIVMNMPDQEGSREVIREFSQYDPRFADLQKTSMKPLYTTKESVGEAGKVLDSAESIVRPWIGNYDPNGAHLWDGPKGDMDDYFLALDKIQFVLEIFGAASDGEKVQEKAHNLFRSGMMRLEEEFRYILSKFSQSYHEKAKEVAPLNLIPDGDSTIGSIIEGNQAGEWSLVRLNLLPKNALETLMELATKLVKGGFGQSLMATYKRIRKRIVEETISKLNISPLTAEDIAKLEWETLEKRIDDWLLSVGIAVRVVFASERALCEKIFVDAQLAENCFAELSLGGVVMLLGFSEAISSSKKSPERLFRVLEMYEAIRDLTPNFDTVFSGDKCNYLRESCEIALGRLSEAAQGIFSEFEHAIERDATKNPVPGGAVHGLTRYVVNYLILLYDYRTTLSQLFQREGKPLAVPKLLKEPMGEGEEETFSDEEYSDDETEIPEHKALAETNKWKFHVLKKNLEGKSKLYKDLAQGNLFMMNNVHYIASKVKNSDLRRLLGDSWIRLQALAVRRYANLCQRQTWGKLLQCMQERFKQCNAILEEIHKTQGQWAVPETPLREELRAAITERVMGSYRTFYGRYARVLESGKHPSKYIKYAPGDVEVMIQELFLGSKPTGK